MKSIISLTILLSIISTSTFAQYRRLYFEAEDSFFPTLYITDGNDVINPDWGGVYPLAEKLRDDPPAYEHAFQYERFASRVKWLSVGTLASFVLAIIGGGGASDTMLWLGGIGVIGTSLGALHYQSKAMYHLHEAVNSYNRQFDRERIMGLNYQTSF